ncbi:MAG: sulfotransferase [Bacteroidetes bacterium]|nr:sulfotransferase [Bacteroidota bacterium]
MQPKVLIVTGMHRSGTSLITNWLSHCGLQVGECLVGANESNKEGHYEDVEFLRIHEEILSSNGYPATGLIYHKPIQISEYQLEKLKAVLEVKKRHFDQWGWKEPRTCLFLDTYRYLIPDAKYLVIVRDHASVVNSLLKREFDLVDKGYRNRSFLTRLKWNLFRKARKRSRYYRQFAPHFLQVWIDYNEQILRMLENLPPKDHLVINYELLQIRDREVYNFLTEEWGFELKYSPFGKIYNQSLISPLRDIDSLVGDGSIIEKAKEIESKFKSYMSVA